MNRYRGLPVPPEAGEQPISLHHAQLDLGLRGDLRPRQLPEGSSPNLIDVRFERGGFRKDFGEKYLGQAAARTILNIIEHKFLGGAGAEVPQGLAFHRLLRLYRNPEGFAELQIWNNESGIWVFDSIAHTTGDTPVPISIIERYVRAVSVQNVVLFAVKGHSILIRLEDPILGEEGDDFPSGTTLSAEGDDAVVIFTSEEDVFGDQFSVNFNIALELIGEGTLSVEMAVIVDGEVVGTKVFAIENPPTSLQGFVDQSIDFVKPLVPGQAVRLEINDITAVDQGAIDREDLTTYADAGPDWATPPISAIAVDEEYQFTWTVEYPDLGMTHNYRFWRYDSGTDTWIVVRQEEFSNGEFLIRTHNTIKFFIDNVAVGDRFGLSIDNPPSGYDFRNGEVNWVSGTADHNVTVEPYNKDTDGDPKHGLTYNTVVGTDVVFTDTEGPEALWIESFADRVVALVDGTDTQILWWTPSADVENWDPMAVGAGRIALFDTRNDPIDDLQCAAPLSSDSLAIFRTRSIMRAFRTGQSVQAIGVNHWLENIGTESPFSRQVTPVGIIFLGHDRMVYVLTESGIRPVGLPIHQILIERLTDHLDRVDAIFDPVFQHYYLGIPVFGSEKICEIYILDVARLMNEDKIVWRKRSCGNGLERFGIASEL